MIKIILLAALTLLQGGPQLQWFASDWLMVRIANASEQRWIVVGSGPNQKLILAAIVDGRLVVYAVDVSLSFRDASPGPFPGPEPKPEPEPGPQPDPSPEPQPVGPFTVAIVEESADRDSLPPEIVRAITSQPVRQYISDRKSEFLLLDKDAETQSQTIKELIAEAVRHPLPRLVIRDSRGRIVVNEPLPAEQALLEILKRVLK